MSYKESHSCSCVHQSWGSSQVELRQFYFYSPISQIVIGALESNQIAYYFPKIVLKMQTQIFQCYYNERISTNIKIKLNKH